MRTRYCAGVVAVLFAACGFPEPTLIGGGDGGQQRQDGSTGGDDAGSGMHDGAVVHDAPPSQFCYGNPSSGYYVCLTAAPTTPLSGSLQVVTGQGGSSGDNGTGCATNVVTPSDNSVCVAAFSSISLGDGNAITATGFRPFVLVSDSDMTIGDGATIDVGSHRTSATAQTAGAGATLGPCNLGTQTVATGVGGAGGSFNGAGGDGVSTGGTAANPSTPGPVFTASDLHTLRGGCPGQTGFDNPSTVAGDGGGVVALIATGTITLDGVVASGGAGASGGYNSGNQYYGGGGGGTGGMIQIDASTLAGNGILAAPGGGGSQGAGTIPGAGASNGATGEDPLVQPGNNTFANGAAGGTSTITGGAGGNGSSTASVNGVSGVKSGTGSTAGGGGGGGGAGWILLHLQTDTFSGTTLPPPAPN